jgi:hypothetical protein
LRRARRFGKSSGISASETMPRPLSLIGCLTLRRAAAASLRNVWLTNLTKARDRLRETPHPRNHYRCHAHRTARSRGCSGLGTFISCDVNAVQNVGSLSLASLASSRCSSSMSHLCVVGSRVRVRRPHTAINGESNGRGGNVTV